MKTYSVAATEHSGSQRVSEELDTLAKGGAVSLLGSIAGRIMTFVLHVMLARGLGSTGYGSYALAIAVVGLARNIATLGIPRAMIRFLSAFHSAKDKKNFDKTLRLSLRIILALSFLVTICLLSYGDLFLKGFVKDRQTRGALTIMLISIPFCGIVTWGVSFLNALKSMVDRALVWELGLPVAQIVLIGGSLIIKGGLFYVSVAYVLSFAVLVPMTFIICRRRRRDADRQFLSQNSNHVAQLAAEISWHSILRVSAPLFLSSFSYAAILYMDRIMLGHFTNTTSVGIYNAASIISLKLSLILLAVNRIFAPLISSSFALKDKENMNLIFKKAAWWALISTLPLFIIVICNCKIIMSIYGEDFISGWSVLFILANGQLYNVIAGPVGLVLQMTGKHNLDFVGNLALVAMNIGLNLLLIPHYGMLGAAIATVTSVVFVMTLRIYQVYQHLKIFPFSKRYSMLLAVVLPLVALGAYLNLSAMTWYIGILVTIAGLAVVGFAIKHVGDKQDVDALKSILGKTRINRIIRRTSAI